MKIQIDSDIPKSAGLGSSASLACSLTASVYEFNLGKPIENNLLLSTAKQIENIFHGKEGSGLDVTVSMRGGIILYQRDEGFEKVDASKFKHQLLIIDTGVRKESTAKVIEHVR
jgi:mevalonate kinase